MHLWTNDGLIPQSRKAAYRNHARARAATTQNSGDAVSNTKRADAKGLKSQQVLKTNLKKRERLFTLKAHGHVPVEYVEKLRQIRNADQTPLSSEYRQP